MLRVADVTVDAEATAAVGAAVGKSPSLFGRAGKAISSVFKLSGDTTAAIERAAPASARPPPKSAMTPAVPTVFPEIRESDVVDTIFGPALICKVRGGRQLVSPIHATTRTGSGPTRTTGGAAAAAVNTAVAKSRGSTSVGGSEGALANAERGTLQQDQTSRVVLEPSKRIEDDSATPLLGGSMEESPAVFMLAAPSTSPRSGGGGNGGSAQASASSFVSSPSGPTLSAFISRRPPLSTPLPDKGGPRRVRPGPMASSLSTAWTSAAVAVDFNENAPPQPSVEVVAGEEGKGEEDRAEKAGIGIPPTPSSSSLLSVDNIGASMTTSAGAGGSGRGNKIFSLPAKLAVPMTPGDCDNTTPPSPAGASSVGGGGGGGGDSSGHVGRQRRVFSSAFAGSATGAAALANVDASDDSDDDGMGSPIGVRILERGKEARTSKGGKAKGSDGEVLYEVRGQEMV